jgi:hypothetical protein
MEVWLGTLGKRPIFVDAWNTHEKRLFFKAFIKITVPDIKLRHGFEVRSIRFLAEEMDFHRLAPDDFEVFALFVADGKDAVDIVGHILIFEGRIDKESLDGHVTIESGYAILDLDLVIQCVFPALVEHRQHLVPLWPGGRVISSLLPGDENGKVENDAYVINRRV